MDTAARSLLATTARHRLLALAVSSWTVLAWTGAATAQDPAPLTSAADVPAQAPMTQEQAYTEFKRLFEAGEHAAAVEQARKVVELAERTEASGAEELQVAVMNLGLAERTAGDFVAAQASYQRAIALIEDSGRRTSPRYARAHAGLALTYYDARRYDLAAPTFERAIVLSRRADGLFTEDQLPLLEKQADTLTELGRIDEALQAHRYALRLVGRRSGERSLRYAAELESFGRWYSRARAYEASRATLKRAADLIGSLNGPDALELIGPLTGIAENARRWLNDPQAWEQRSDDAERRSMFHDPMLPGPPKLSTSTVETEGRVSLERAAAIAESHPDAVPASAAAVHVQLGDWHQSRGSPERALPHYQRAWQAAAEVAEDGRALNEVLFAEPLLLYLDPPSGWDRYAQRPPEEVERRDVEVEITVTAQGRVRDARIVADGGDPKLAARGQRAAESARYRPRFIDGEPVDAPGIRYIQPFIVLREVAPESEPEPAAEPSPPPEPPQRGG